MQKKLIFQIKNENNQWKAIVKSIKRYKTLINAVNPFRNLIDPCLIDDLAIITFLTSIFPLPQLTLTVVVDDLTEDENFLHHFPRLISAYDNYTLTTLQFIWKVKDATIQIIFNPFTAQNHWADILQARQNGIAASNTGSEFSLIKIANHYITCDLRNATPLLYSSLANAATAHINSVEVDIKTPTELEYLTRSANFANLKKLRIRITSEALSVGVVLFQLAKLVHLNELYLICDNLKKINYPNHHLLPVMPALRQLILALMNRKPLRHDEVNTEALRPAEMFPNAKSIFLYLHTDRCSSCGWHVKVPSDRDQITEMVSGNAGQVFQCVTKLATPFGAGKTKPRLGVSLCKKGKLKTPCTVYFDDNGRVKRIKKYSGSY